MENASMSTLDNSMSTLDNSLFVSDKVHPKEVVLSDKTKHTLYFKELTSVEYRKFYFYESSEDEDKRAISQAYLISVAMCDENGNPVITVEQASKLKNDALISISRAIKEVNNLKDAETLKK
jgi:hypothetical protein